MPQSRSMRRSMRHLAGRVRLCSWNTFVMLPTDVCEQHDPPQGGYAYTGGASYGWPGASYCPGPTSMCVPSGMCGPTGSSSLAVRPVPFDPSSFLPTMTPLCPYDPALELATYRSKYAVPVQRPCWSFGDRSILRELIHLRLHGSTSHEFNVPTFLCLW